MRLPPRLEGVGEDHVWDWFCLNIPPRGATFGEGIVITLGMDIRSAEFCPLNWPQRAEKQTVLVVLSSGPLGLHARDTLEEGEQLRTRTGLGPAQQRQEGEQKTYCLDYWYPALKGC